MTRGEILNLIMDTLNDRPDVDRVHMEVDLDAMTTNVVVATAGRTYTIVLQED